MGKAQALIDCGAKGPGSGPAWTVRNGLTAAFTTDAVGCAYQHELILAEVLSADQFEATCTPMVGT